MDIVDKLADGRIVVASAGAEFLVLRRTSTEGKECYEQVRRCLTHEEALDRAKRIEAREDPEVQRRQQEKVAAFLEELSTLTRKHGVMIGGCGCCGSPWLEFGEFSGCYNAEYVELDDKYGGHLQYQEPGDGS